MAAKEFDIPELPTYIEIPELTPDVMKGEGPFKSIDEFQNPLGFPGGKVDNWKEVAIEKMGDLKSKYRSVQVFLDSCVKCGA
ncbi:(Fe-S)-binding protein, partial [Candidatus Thioglobus sp.]|nr:(Fe-S)-binding protein [Candidatus Thioglobus sp.]